MQLVEMDFRNLVWGNFLASSARCWLISVHRGMLGIRKEN